MFSQNKILFCQAVPSHFLSLFLLSLLLQSIPSHPIFSSNESVNILYIPLFSRSPESQHLSTLTLPSPPGPFPIWNGAEQSGASGQEEKEKIKEKGKEKKRKEREKPTADPPNYLQSHTKREEGIRTWTWNEGRYVTASSRHRMIFGHKHNGLGPRSWPR